MPNYGSEAAGLTNRLGGIANAPTPMQDESASLIRDAVTESEQLLSSLQDTIASIERRLDTALTPEPPTIQKLGDTLSKSPMVESHLRGRLIILNEGWNHAIRRLMALRQRVEI